MEQIDKAKLLEYIENEIRLCKELGSVFDDRRFALTILLIKIEKGDFTTDGTDRGVEG